MGGPTFNETVTVTTGGLVLNSGVQVLRDKYLLADHLSSSHAEASQSASELGQRRMYPFGSDRAVSGASDLSVEERYTGQRRLDAGNGNTKRELYYYGARWYLPGVGIFSQPDISAIEPHNPQNLNRYAYVMNNPVCFADPTGYQVDEWIGEQPVWFNEEWQGTFEAVHGHSPSAEDYAWRFVSMSLTSGILESMAELLEIPEHQKGIYSKPDESISSGELMARMNLLYELPEPVDFERNLSLSDYMRGGNLVTFVGMVMPGGPWDFKRTYGDRPPIENAGNVHFGAVGSAWGFSEGELISGAGAAQKLSARLLGSQGGRDDSLTHGDDPRDTLMIMVGIAFYRNYRSVVPPVSDQRFPSPVVPLY